MSLDLFLEDICILVLILSINTESELNRSIKNANNSGKNFFIWRLLMADNSFRVISLWSTEVSNFNQSTKSNIWGLGDLIRGTFQLYQICRKHNFYLCGPWKAYPRIIPSVVGRSSCCRTVPTFRASFWRFGSLFFCRQFSPPHLPTFQCWHHFLLIINLA